MSATRAYRNIVECVADQFRTLTSVDLDRMPLFTLAFGLLGAWRLKIGLFPGNLPVPVSHYFLKCFYQILLKVLHAWNQRGSSRSKQKTTLDNVGSTDILLRDMHTLVADVVNLKRRMRAAICCCGRWTRAESLLIWTATDHKMTVTCTFSAPCVTLL